MVVVAINRDAANLVTVGVGRRTDASGNIVARLREGRVGVGGLRYVSVGVVGIGRRVAGAVGRGLAVVVGIVSRGVGSRVGIGGCDETAIGIVVVVGLVSPLLPTP
jgi:hypothetical protein